MGCAGFANIVLITIKSQEIVNSLSMVGVVEMRIDFHPEKSVRMFVNKVKYSINC